MKIKHLVKVIFDRRSPAITQEWLDNRYEFFAANTLRSLQAQTFKDFTLWLSFGDSGMQDMWKNLRRILERQDQRSWINWAVTFNAHKPESWLDLENSCPDHFYVTRIDSDDLYGPDALRLANECRPLSRDRVEASVFRRGYLHDVRTGETGVYFSPSPPFHTMMIPREVFVDPARYAAMNYGDHSRVNTDFPTQVLPDWQFAVLVHGSNTTTTMEYRREHRYPVDPEWSINKFLEGKV